MTRPPPPPDDAARTALATVRAVQELTKATGEVSRLFKRLPGVQTPDFRAPNGGGANGGNGRPAPASAAVAVRLVRFEGTAMGQLASLLAKNMTAAGTAARKPAASVLDPLKPLTVAAAATTATLAGMARAGLANTVEGYRLEQAFLMLNRSIAGIFLPVIDTATAGIEKLAFTLMNLDDGRKNVLMKAGLGVAGVGALGGGLAALAPLIGPVVNLFTSLGPAIAGVLGVGAPAVVAIAAVGGGLAYLATASKPVRDAMEKLWGALQQVWEATKPLREALFEVGEKLATSVLTGVADALTALANNTEVVGTLRLIGDTLVWVAEVGLTAAKHLVAGFMALDAEVRKRGGLVGIAAGAGAAAGRALEDGEGGLAAAQALARNLAGQGGGIVAGINKAIAELENAPKAPIGKGADADQGAKNNPPGRLPTPFTPGRGDALSVYNALQDSALKFGKADDVPKQHLEVAQRQEAKADEAVRILNEILQRLGFNPQPFLNGRPGAR